MLIFLLIVTFHFSLNIDLLMSNNLCSFFVVGMRVWMRAFASVCVCVGGVGGGWGGGLRVMLFV